MDFSTPEQGKVAVKVWGLDTHQDQKSEIEKKMLTTIPERSRRTREREKKRTSSWLNRTGNRPAHARPNWEVYKKRSWCRESLLLSLFLAPSMPLDDDTLEEEEEKFKRARAWMVFQKQPLENAGKQSAKNSWNDSRKPSSGPFGKLLFLFFFSLSSSSFPCTILRPCVLVGSCGKRSSFSSSRRSNGSRTHTHT